MCTCKELPVLYSGKIHDFYYCPTCYEQLDSPFKHENSCCKSPDVIENRDESRVFKCCKSCGERSILRRLTDEKDLLLPKATSDLYLGRYNDYQSEIRAYLHFLEREKSAETKKIFSQRKVYINYLKSPEWKEIRQRA